MASTIKPLIVLKRDLVTKPDISRLRKNGLCVIECDDPSSIRFSEPPPLGYGEQEAAAIKLFRHLMSVGGVNWDRMSISRKYVEIILEGGPLDPFRKIEPVKKLK